MGLVRFTLKATVASGFVYYTVYEGLWSKSQESVKLYEKIYNNTVPLLSKNLPKEVIHEFEHLPSTTAISSFLRTSWNQGVMSSMKFLADSPCHVHNGLNGISETVQKYLKEQS